MTLHAAPAVDPATVHWPAGIRLGERAIATIIFLSGFVIVEPAPYDLVLVAIIVAWTAVGLRIPRATLPLVALLLLYLVGGLLSLTQMESLQGAPLYLAITAFLAGSSVFFAAIIAQAPERRFAIISRSLIVAGVAVAAFGTIAYFEVFPGASSFKLAGRASGTFQDPNVFGPYLVLPAVILTYYVLTHRLRASLWSMVWLAIIVLAIFLSFSRAAWGHLIVSTLTMAALAFVTRSNSGGRMRVAGYFVALTVTIATMLSAAISIPAVSGILSERAQLVQYYDAGENGRFSNQAAGLADIPAQPLGIGPGVFAEKYGDDEHNMWLKGFMAYGWLGGFAYIALAAWTLAAAFPLLFVKRPWQPFIHAVYSAFVGNLMIHMVIDSDHWRTLFLMYGFLWGAIAAERALRSNVATRHGS